MQVYIWENIENKGFEYLKVKTYSNKIIVTSTIIDTLETNKIEYEVTLTNTWSFLQLKLKNDKLENELVLSRDSNNKWIDAKSRVLDHLTGAIDIDLTCTPFTNTLPINRCNWTKDEPKNFEMAYIDANNLSVKKSKQTYTLINDDLTKKVFKYSSGSFESDILVKDDGFVLEYPMYFKLLSNISR